MLSHKKHRSSQLYKQPCPFLHIMSKLTIFTWTFCLQLTSPENNKLYSRTTHIAHYVSNVESVPFLIKSRSEKIENNGYISKVTCRNFIVQRTSAKQLHGRRQDKKKHCDMNKKNRTYKCMNRKHRSTIREIKKKLLWLSPIYIAPFIQYLCYMTKFLRNTFLLM